MSAIALITCFLPPRFPCTLTYPRAQRVGWPRLPGCHQVVVVRDRGFLSAICGCAMALPLALEKEQLLGSENWLDQHPQSVDCVLPTTKREVFSASLKGSVSYLDPVKFLPVTCVVGTQNTCLPNKEKIDSWKDN